MILELKSQDGFAVCLQQSSVHFQFNMILSQLEDALKRQILSQFARLGKTNVMLNGKTVDLQDPNLNLEELLAAGIDLRFVSFHQ